MVLGTGEEISLAEFGHNHLVLLCEDLSAFRAVEDKLHAQGALDSVQITTRGKSSRISPEWRSRGHRQW